MEPRTTQQPWTPTFGEQLVGITFNPSGDPKVQRAKVLCAELVDLLNDHYRSKESSQLEQTLFDHTIGEVLNAQMNAVKLLTFKY
jgi:hypothetical protein